MKPIIGITSRTAPISSSNLNYAMVQTSYVNAVLQAGGVPVVIPSDITPAGYESLFARMDGILISGGGDISLDYFAGEPHKEIYGIEPMRDAIEIGLCRLAAEKGLPFLGICRGVQIMNVALGGTLYTHIPDQLPSELQHDYPGSDGVPARTSLAHAVVLEHGSSIAQLMGAEQLKVNSLHHQGVKDVAPGLSPVGRSSDGLVEALEMPGHPFAIGVQWHPEWLTDQPVTRNLFGAFVEAAAQHK